MPEHDPSLHPGLTALPRFCPLCQAGEPEGSDSDLCPRCGDPLVEQGFCPICEDFWKQTPGSLCPKHDVELLDEPPRSAITGDRSSLVTVATYAHPNQANAPRIRLEAEGIPTFLDGERIAGNTLYQVATGGVRLMVPADLASSARILIDQSWAPPSEDDDLEDAWDELAPEPGQRRRAAMKAAIVLILLGPAAVYLAQILAFLGRLLG